MPDARTIIDGIPGEYWLNETTKPWYQLEVSGNFTCGLCWSYNGKVARYWPLPFHGHCRCRQRQIKVGQRAPMPFVDFEKEIISLPPDQQNAVMGKSLFQLWKRGVIEYGDAVTASRVRSLESVVALKKLSIKDLVKAGVRPDIAAKAHSAVHTEEHQQVAAHRKELLHKIAGAGVAHEMTVKHIAERIAGRVTIAPGPTYTTKAGVILPGITGGGAASPAETRARQAAELKAVLGTKEGVRKAVAALKKAPARRPKPAPVATPPPASPASPPPGSPAHMVRYAAEQGYEVEVLSPAELKARFGATDADIRGGVMLYDARTRRIYINPSADIFDQPDIPAYIAKQEANRWMASGHPMAIVDHEIGHAKHHAASPDRYRDPALKRPFDPDTAKRVAEWVSGYAATDPLEFVAEVYSGMKAGKTYNKIVMDYYGSLGGVIPR